MGRFVLKHLVFLTLTLLVVSFLVFTLNEFSPGDVARKLLGEFATQEQVDLLTRELGLHRPLPVRYVEYVGKVLSGDLGQSLRFKVPVRDILFDAGMSQDMYALQLTQFLPMLKTKEFKLSIVGDDKVGERAAQVFRVSRAGRPDVNIAVDKETALPIRCELP